MLIVSARRDEQTRTSRPLVRRVAVFHCTSSISDKPSSASMTTSARKFRCSTCTYARGFWWPTCVRSRRS